MTLKTWLSSGHSDALKSKMAAAIDILPLHNPTSPNRTLHETTSSGLTVLPNGDVTLRRNRAHSSVIAREAKFRSVEDGLESSGEQGDYGFLEYYSLRKVPHRNPSYEDSRSAVTYGTWNRVNGSCGRAGGWPNSETCEFYPPKSSYGEKVSRKRSRGDRPRSYHQEERPTWQPEEMRTSTPLSPAPSSDLDPSYVHNESHRENPPDEPSSPHRGCGLVKRNSVLWRLRPDRWKNFDGSLRRSRSKDDVLSSCKGRKKCELGASQPDLLTSHGASNDEEGNHVVPPAFSILPPTCKSAVVNHSQTLPRGRRPSDANKENTLLARGRRWLTGATFRGERTTERGDSEIMVKVETVAPEWPVATTIPVAVTTNKETRGATSPSEKRVPASGDVLADLQQRSRARNRRPRTFYLLEDYLSPVRNPQITKNLNMGVELDEYITRAPRLLFREAPKRPIPPTPEWDTPSLSPPPSLLSCQSGQSHQINVSNNQSNRDSGRDRSVFIDTLIPSPEKSTHSIYSPVFSPRDSGYPRFVTPEVALPEHSLGIRPTPSLSNGLSSNTNAYSSTHSHNHNNYAPIYGLTRRSTEREDKRWSRNNEDQVQKVSLELFYYSNH